MRLEALGEICWGTELVELPENCSSLSIFLIEALCCKELFEVYFTKILCCFYFRKTHHRHGLSFAVSLFLRGRYSVIA